VGVIVKEDYVLKTLEKLEKSVDNVDNKCDRIDTTLAVMTAKFEEHLKQDEKMYEEFKSMVQILRENTDSLKEHVLRTNTLQDMVIGINNRLEPIEQDRLKKAAVTEFIKSKAAFWAKIGGAAGGIITIIYYIIKIRTGA